MEAELRANQKRTGEWSRPQRLRLTNHWLLKVLCVINVMIFITGRIGYLLCADRIGPRLHTNSSLTLIYLSTSLLRQSCEYVYSYSTNFISLFSQNMECAVPGPQSYAPPIWSRKSKINPSTVHTRADDQRGGKSKDWADIITDILTVFFLIGFRSNITFCSVPGHAGIWGNERVDQIEKQSLTREVDVHISWGRGAERNN